MPIEVELLKLRQFLERLEALINETKFPVKFKEDGIVTVIRGSVSKLCVMKCDCLKAIAALSLKDMRTV